MYCGICIEVCPFDALHWSPEFEYAELDIRDLLHEKDRLGAWMATVPAPPALDPGSADPAEVTAAARPARPPAAPVVLRAAGRRCAGRPGCARSPRRRRPRTDPTRVLPAVEQTSPVAPADGAEAEQAADQAAAQGDSTQVLPTVSTDEEGRE